jgi:two-component system chemotaxis response regulator CheB
VAQDEASSIVYGMPREAALLNAADQILPLTQIGSYLTRAISAGAPRRE